MDSDTAEGEEMGVRVAMCVQLESILRGSRVKGLCVIVKVFMSDGKGNSTPKYSIVLYLGVGARLYPMFLRVSPAV